ncbi:NlpC/P60 family protein [Streptomyces sp. BI20]|uniref:C40 family peptidase n=1 Tax=Streptomyces sp. BI20 TaxID=3403460 RepID=UPI003C717C44
MASHRKPRRPRAAHEHPSDAATGGARAPKGPRGPFGGAAARIAAALALAGAAGAGGLDGAAHAAPAPDPARIRAEADRLHREAEAAGERANGAAERADAAARALAGLRAETARRTARLDAARDGLGAVAAARYREGSLGPAVRLALSRDPARFLDRAALMDRAGQRSAAKVAEVRRGMRAVDEARAKAEGTLAELRREQAALAREKAAAGVRLTEARALLDRLGATERARWENGPDTGTAPDTARAPGTAHGANGAPGTPAAVPAVAASNTAGSSRAARAVSYARGAIGKPYVWGATGPSGYDCSGLTQAAWRAAGVSLPRTTYTQINAGRRVSRDRLAPGDLVFFYSGVSHVGIYIGDGKMIHAPRSGSTVRVAPVDSMPFAGAARPA